MRWTPIQSQSTLVAFKGAFRMTVTHPIAGFYTYAITLPVNGKETDRFVLASGNERGLDAAKQQCEMRLELILKAARDAELWDDGR